MQTFQIYSTTGECHELSFERFVFNGDRFILYDSANRPSNYGYLAVEHVAAIYLPNKPTEMHSLRRGYGLRCFHVYLKSHKNPLEVYAHQFRIKGEEIEFIEKYPEHTQTTSRIVSEKISQLYFKASEVVAIMPSEGLQWRS